MANVTPFNGQTGVLSNATVVLTFSEPMNQASVRAAYSSSTLLVGQLTFNWNAAGTVLTLVPTNPLQYASGTSLAIAALAYSFQISTAARDLAGNSLAMAFSSSFTTLRRISTSVSGSNVFVLLDSTPNGDPVLPIPCGAAGTASLGHQVGLVFAAVLKLYVTFNIPAAPPGVASVESAVVRGVQDPPTADPYALSTLTANQIPFQAAPSNPSNVVTPTRSLGVFATSGSTAIPSVAAVPTAQQAFDADGEQVMVRFEFGALPVTQALATFECNAFALDWTYLAR